MRATKQLKLEIVRIMKLVGISIPKKRDADNSTMEDAAAMITTLSVRKLVSVDANANNKLHRHNPAVVIWTNSDRNIVCCNQILDRVEPDSSDTIMTVKRVCVMYSLTVDVEAIKITSKRPKSAKTNVEMYKIFAHCHRSVDAVKKMLHGITMIDVAMHVNHSNTVDVVETKIISIQKETVTHNVNADAQSRHSQRNNQTSMM